MPSIKWSKQQKAIPPTPADAEQGKGAGKISLPLPDAGGSSSL